VGRRARGIRVPERINDFKSLSLRKFKLERWRRGVFSVPLAVYYPPEHFLSRFQMRTFHFALNATFSIGFGNRHGHGDGLPSDSGALVVWPGLGCRSRIDGRIHQTHLQGVAPASGPSPRSRRGRQRLPANQGRTIPAGTWQYASERPAKP
jgi:hypothetical protein